MQLGKFIAFRRKSLKVSQGDFAGLVGITQNYLSQIEHDRKEPTMSTLQAIATHLKLPLPIVFFLSMDKNDVSNEKADDFDRIYPKLQSIVIEDFEL